jgi:hypothetical protein
MKATIEQVHGMLRDKGVAFFVSDDGQATLFLFDDDVRMFHLMMLAEEDELLFSSVNVLRVGRETPRLHAVLDELLAAPMHLRHIRVARDPDNGTIDCFCAVPWPAHDDDSGSLARMLEEIADDVRQVLFRLNEVQITGKTSHERAVADTDKSIETLFANSCDEFPKESQARNPSAEP